MLERNIQVEAADGIAEYEIIPTPMAMRIRISIIAILFPLFPHFLHM